MSMLVVLICDRHWVGKDCRAAHIVNHIESLLDNIYCLGCMHTFTGGCMLYVTRQLIVDRCTAVPVTNCT
jgi:hypothetical protein